MNAKKRRRLYFAAALVAAGGVLASAIVYELGNNVLYFYSPSDLAATLARRFAELGFTGSIAIAFPISFIARMLTLGRVTAS